MAIDTLKRKDRENQLERLAGMPTTQLYHQIQDSATQLQKPEYITTNSSNNRAIQIIFSLRWGNPLLNENQVIRHQTSDDKCHCGEKETIRHFLEECKSYAAPRQHIKQALNEKGYSRFSLHDIWLYDKTFSKRLAWLAPNGAAKLDNLIKDYLVQITKIRLEQIQAATWWGGRCHKPIRRIN